MDDYLLFRASNGASGYELWRSDGTLAGTSLLKDFDPGAANGNAAAFTRFNGEVYLTATNATTGTDIWKTDGTPAGTVLLKDIFPGAGSGVLTTPYFTEVNGHLYFAANDGSSGEELWRTDGTALGTVRVADVTPGVVGSSLKLLQNVNGTLVFMNGASRTHSYVWSSDGTAAGTKRLSDAFAANFEESLVIGDYLYFQGIDNFTGRELWKTDGTALGTQIVRDIAPGVANASPGALSNIGDMLYFMAEDPINGFELWRSDGTATGTARLTDIAAGIADGSPNQHIVINGKLLFSATDGERGRELWSMDWSPRQEGDFNNDGSVDGADFLAWQRGFGFSETPIGGGADGDSDGTIGGGDLDVWKTGFGAPQGSVPSVAASLASNDSELSAKDIADQGASVAAVAVAQVEPVAARRSATALPTRERDAREVARDALFAMGDVSAMFAIEDETAADWLARRRRR